MVFVTINHFLPSVILRRKAGAYLSGALLVYAPSLPANITLERGNFQYQTLEISKVIKIL
jgi:hypothetical protein